MRIDDVSKSGGYRARALECRSVLRDNLDENGASIWMRRGGRGERQHGLTRCRYKGLVGMNRWVGLGVIADNIVNIGRALQKQAVP
jgi:hypothetical protein